MWINVRCEAMNDQDQSIWDLYRHGRSARQIGRELEVSHRTVQNRLNKHGGIGPAERRRGTGRLSFDDREEISRGVAAGLSASSIASALERPASTISREIARNGGVRCTGPLMLSNLRGTGRCVRSRRSSPAMRFCAAMSSTAWGTSGHVSRSLVASTSDHLRKLWPAALRHSHPTPCYECRRR